MADPTIRTGTVLHEPRHLVVPESREIQSLLGRDKGTGEDVSWCPVVKSGATSAPIGKDNNFNGSKHMNHV